MRDKVLGWSASRYELFKLCKRQYYYQYYGLRFDEFIIREKLQLLKDLVSVPLLVGSLTHDLIAQVLRRLRTNPETIEPAKFFAYAEQVMDKHLLTARFLEEYYLESQVDRGQLKQDVKKALDDFFASRWYKWINGIELKDRRDWLIEPGDYGICKVGNLKAFCKVDFAFPLKDEVYVLDWKTGKIDEPKHKRQLLGYINYVMEHFRVTPEKVKAGLAYIGRESGEQQAEFSPEDLKGFAEQVKNETSEMYQYCLDVTENVPLPKEKFPLCYKPNICLQCNYQELCRAEF